MPYINFSDEQKQRANQVDLENFLQQQGEELLPAGREKRLAADHSVTVHGNKWYDHAKEQGGLAVDFMQFYYNMSFVEAMSVLLGGEQGECYPAARSQSITLPKPFALPPAYSTMRRVFAYLTKQRGISPAVISHFAHERLLYESCEPPKDKSKEYHNAVFVGVDENGVPRHAHKRSLNSQGKSFRLNVEGSDPRYSFHWLGESPRLYVFEAPIDLLSFLSLYPVDWQTHSYVALCGLGGQALDWLLEQYPQLNKVALCLDNDAAGRQGTERLKQSISGLVEAVVDLIPPRKDWNEVLVAQGAVSVKEGDLMCQTML